MFVLRRLLLICVLCFSCVVSAETKTSDTKLKVVTTFSILADMVSVIGGEYVDVYTLVGPEQDVHVYQPRPKDAQHLAKADVLVANGLGFEGWIERLILASGYQGPVVRASDHIPLLLTTEFDHDLHDHGERGHDHNEGAYDPHAWQDLKNASVYIANIAEALISADGAHRDAYVANRDSYSQSLRELDGQVRQQLAGISAERRKLLTSHQAYRYFEASYNVEFFAAQGINTGANVSARDVADLIRLIKTENINAAFFESSSNTRLLQQIADETHCTIAGSLFADSLSKDQGPTSTYLGMMRYNLQTILDALPPR